MTYVNMIETQPAPAVSQPSCPACGTLVYPTDNFCPTCGKKITKELEYISIGRQLYVYAVSLLAPPFGLVWTFKYLKQKSQQVNTVGIIALVLTVVSLAVTIWLTFGVISTAQSFMNTNYNSSFPALQNGGL